NGDFDRIFTCSWLGTDRSGRAPRFEGNFSSRKSDVFRKRILLSYTSTPLALRAPARYSFLQNWQAERQASIRQREICRTKGVMLQSGLASISRLEQRLG